MVFTACTCEKDINDVNTTELPQKIAAFIFIFCYKSVEQMLLVKRINKQNKRQMEARYFSARGHRNWELKQNKSALIDTSGFQSCCFVFVQPWTPPRTRARMWSAVAIRSALLRASRGPCVSIAKKWSTGRWRFSFCLQMCWLCWEDFRLNRMDISVGLVSIAFTSVSVKSLLVSGWKAIDCYM